MKYFINFILSLNQIERTKFIDLKNLLLKYFSYYNHNNEDTNYNKLQINILFSYLNKEKCTFFSIYFLINYFLIK
jgi:hypothetical protein